MKIFFDVTRDLKLCCPTSDADFFKGKLMNRFKQLKYASEMLKMDAGIFNFHNKKELITFNAKLCTLIRHFFPPNYLERKKYMGQSPGLAVMGGCEFES